jgi:hypothetical protein
MAAKKSSSYGYDSILGDFQPKQRVFILKGKKNPLRFQIQSKHAARKPLTYFDGRLNRALRYATNQITPFIDEQDGYATLEPIVFENGTLIVPDWNVNLQKFLLIHPEMGRTFIEFDPDAEATDTYEKMNIELEAQIAIRELSIDELEAVARVALKGVSNVSNMTSNELKRDMLIWAKNNPSLTFDILNDENIKLRNIAVRAVESNILFVKDDQRTVVWSDDKRQKVLAAPYGENVYSALAAYFKTDEGLDVMQKIVNLL